VTQLPQPFVRRHEAVHVAAAVGAIRKWPAGQHALENPEEVFRNLEIRHVARVVEGNEDFIRKAACVPWHAAGRLALGVFLSCGHSGTGQFAFVLATLLHFQPDCIRQDIRVSILRQHRPELAIGRH